MSTNSQDGVIVVEENRGTERKKPVPLSTSNPTWADLGAKHDLHGERLATVRLSYNRALQ
jgi:hypothetical protein